MPTDLDKLRGTWRITALESDGQTVPTASLRGADVVVTDTKFKSTGLGQDYEGRLEVDNTKTPKTVDFVFTSGPQAGARNLGIYRLAGDTWTICLATRGTKRPKTFVTAPRTGLALETLRRAVGQSARTGMRRKGSVGPAQPVEPGRIRDGSATVNLSAGPPTELEGEWQMTAGVFNGAPLEATMVAYCKRITRGNITTVFAGPNVMMQARFTLDAEATPRHIDYVHLAGATKGKSQQGIYELAAGILMISMAAPGKPRPADFTVKTGDGRTYTAFSFTKK